MLFPILFSRTDKLQLRTSAAGEVTTLVTYVKHLETVTPTADMIPDRQVGKFTGAADNDILSTPASTFAYSSKHLEFRNSHATISNDVTFIYNANGTLYELKKCTLLPGESLVCHEGTWFHFDANVGVYGATVALADPRLVTKLLLVDQSNSTTTLTEVTGLTVAVGVGTWAARYFIRSQSTVTTTGIRLSINHTGTVAWFLANWRWPGGTTASADLVDQDFVAAGGQLISGFFARAKSTTGWGTTLGADTNALDNEYEANAHFEVTVAGNLALWHGSEVAAASIIKAGSGLLLTKLN